MYIAAAKYTPLTVATQELLWTVQPPIARIEGYLAPEIPDEPFLFGLIPKRRAAFLLAGFALNANPDFFGKSGPCKRSVTLTTRGAR